MKYNLAFSLLLLSLSLFAQNRFEFVRGQRTNLKPVYSNGFKESVDTVKLQVVLRGGFSAGDKDSNMLFLDGEAFNLLNSPRLPDTVFFNTTTRYLFRLDYPKSLT